MSDGMSEYLSIQMSHSMSDDIDKGPQYMILEWGDGDTRRK